MYLHGTKFVNKRNFLDFTLCFCDPGFFCVVDPFCCILLMFFAPDSLIQIIRRKIGFVDKYINPSLPLKINYVTKPSNKIFWKIETMLFLIRDNYGFDLNDCKSNGLYLLVFQLKFSLFFFWNIRFINYSKIVFEMQFYNPLNEK